MRVRGSGSRQLVPVLALAGLLSCSDQIAEPALQVSGTNLPSGTQGEPYSAQLSAVGGGGSYSWSTVSGSWPAGIALSTSGLASGTPTASGDFTVMVQVASGGQTATRQYHLAIAPPPPAVMTASLPNGVQGQAYSQQLSAAGGVGVYTWTTVSGSWPSGLSLSPAGLVSGTPSVSGTFSVAVQVTSGAQTAARTLQLTVDPLLSITTGSPLPGGAQGTAYSQQLSATGGSGGYAWSTVSGSWPPGLSLSGAGVLSGTATGSGTFTATAQVASGGQTATQAYQLTIDPQLTITTGSPLPDATQGVSYNQQLNATGGAGGYTWATVSGSWPAGISLSAAGLVSGTSPAPGTFNVTVQVTSGGQTAIRAYQLAVVLPAPSITTSSPLPAGTQGVTYSQQLSASGGNGSYSWSTTSGSWPAGISLSGAGVVSGTPTASGTFTATAQVSSGGQTASRTFQLTINPPTLSITTTSPLPDGTEGAAYSRQLSAIGGTGSYSWSTVSGSWPTGVSLSSAGTVGGTPTAAGTFNVTAQVTSGGQTASRAYQLTIVPMLVIATSSPLPGGTQGVSYGQQLSATGGTGSYSWNTVSGSWPSGISLSSTGVVSGTPTGDGTFNATVRVSSGGQTASRAYQLTIAPPPVSITTTSPLPNGTQGVAYSQQLGATGGTGSYTWTTISGSWPTGISLSSGGVVSGTPTVTGIFNATAQVSSGGQTASRAYQLTVNPQALSITTTSPLPNGTQGVAYSQQLNAAGGTGSYTWSTISGSWPGGISLSGAGVVSGTPTGYGTFNATAQVTSGGQTASRAFQLTINPPPLSITTTSPLTGGTQGVLYTQQLNATGGTGSYTWTTTSGSWPSGISLSSAGVVSGTPTASGTFNATAQVTSGSQTASRSFQLTIAAPVTYQLTLDLTMTTWQAGVTVTSSPAGINCSAYYGPGSGGTNSCPASFASGVQVDLSADRDGNWTGCASSTANTCRITMGTANKTVSFIAF